jgi:hypothetical protein
MHPEGEVERPSAARAGPIATSGTSPHAEGKVEVPDSEMGRGKGVALGTHAALCRQGSPARGVGADGAGAAECRWGLPARLGQQRPDGPRVLRTGEKRACQRAGRDYAPGGRLEGQARQGLQEELVNPNRCVQRPEDAALSRGLRALRDERAARYGAPRAARAAEAAEAAGAAGQAQKEARDSGGTSEGGMEARRAETLDANPVAQR